MVHKSTDILTPSSGSMSVVRARKGAGGASLGLAAGFEFQNPPPVLSAGFLFMQVLTWIMGAVAAYRLWDHYAWLSIVVVILALSFAVHPHEQMEQNATGQFSTGTAARLMWTTVGVGAILVFSFFV